MKKIVYFTLAVLLFAACKKEPIEIQETVTEAAINGEYYNLKRV